MKDTESGPSINRTGFGSQLDCVSCLYPRWHRLLREAYPPLEAAVRLAIAGNMLDIGVKTPLDAAAVRGAFCNALTAPVRGSVRQFSMALRNARAILYLADTAGEIVFDRDLLAQLPLGKFLVGVRGGVGLNDATAADAEEAGLSDFCEIISKGSDAPGTVLEDCSPAFRDRFETADLVIAKGQDNYQTLKQTDKCIFFLLSVRCEVLSRSLGYPVGSLVVHPQRASGWEGAGPILASSRKGRTREARL